MRVHNGLRHHDASRYRKYCSYRLGHLRSKLKHKNGRNQFVGQPLPNDFHDIRFLYLPLVQTERSFAAHLEMKNAQSISPGADGLIQISSGKVKV